MARAPPLGRWRTPLTDALRGRGGEGTACARAAPPTQRVQQVRAIGMRIAARSGLADLPWEFHVINSRERNAFVLPGGKVFVFTGILPVMANDAGMAAVLGHEIGHMVARHVAENAAGKKKGERDVARRGGQRRAW